MRTSFVLLLCVCFSAVAFCQDPPKDDGPRLGTPFEIELAKPPVKFWVYVPLSYNEIRSWPLVVLLHGAGDTAQNFIASFEPLASERCFILCAVKSTGEAWVDTDTANVIAAMDDVRSRYRVDVDRSMLLGYSSGSFLASSIGIRYQDRFRALCLLAGASVQGGKGFETARKHLCVLICAGSLDPNLAVCEENYKRLVKDKFDVEFNKIEGMEHSPFKPEALKWFFDKFVERISRPEEVLLRGRKAAMEKRYVDALDSFRKVEKECKGGKLEKVVKEDLDKLNKMGEAELKTAVDLAHRDKARGVEAVKRVIAQFEGLDVVTTAQNALSDLMSAK